MADWENLAAHIRAERERLRYSQTDVQANGGPSATLLRQIEKAQLDRLSARTKNALELGLGWRRGVVDELLNGAAEPRRKTIEIEGPGGQWFDEDDLDETVGATTETPGIGTIKARKPANMSDEDFKRLLNEYSEEIEWKLNRAARERQ